MTRKPLDGFETDASGDEVFGKAASWYKLVGPLYQANDNEPGSVRLAFFSEQRYISSMGRVHGGMISSFVDYLLFGSARSVWVDSMLATVTLNINFIAACPPNEWVVGHGRVIRAGGSTAFVTGDVYAGDKLVAYATGTFRKLGGLPK